MPSRATADPDLAFAVLPIGPGLVAASRADIGLLSGPERQRLDALRRPADRDAYLTTHVELRHRLAARLGVEPAGIGFGRLPCPRCGHPTGRPRLEPYVGVEFSVSHTAGLIAIAIAVTAVGIDVQRRPARVGPAMLRGLHPAETAELLSGPAEALPDRVTRCWTRKEAVLKGVGLGIGHGISHPVVGGGQTPQPVPGWRLTDLAVPNAYAGALAVAAPPSEGTA